MSGTDPLAVTRRSWHGLAELVLAGPQYRRGERIDLRVVPGGFATVVEPDLRVDGVAVMAAGRRVRVNGLTYTQVAAAAGVTASALRDVYRGGPDITPDETVTVDPAAAARLAAAFERGDAALRTFAPDATPILWPEHFDVAITVDEVNYGVSPGDPFLAEPYAYVGPFTVPTGGFWNAPFGAARPLDELPDVDAVVRFFTTGRELSR